MAKQYKQYDEDFKKTIVDLYESGKSIADLSREYGVGHTNIINWIHSLLDGIVFPCIVAFITTIIVNLLG